MNKSNEVMAQQDEREAPYMPLTGAMRLVREKLARFEECAGDDEGCDIGRDWFDALTTIGLLARTQRSPARWSMTPAGEAMLAQQVQAGGEDKRDARELQRDAAMRTVLALGLHYTPGCDQWQSAAQQDGRTAFEAYMRERLDESIVDEYLHRLPRGEYSCWQIELAWECWTRLDAALSREQPQPSNAAACTNSDVWNCKYCDKTTTCEAMAAQSGTTSTAVLGDLSPCPFCGGMASSPEVEQIEHAGWVGRIACDHCDAVVSLQYSSSSPGIAGNAVIAAWNCRASEQPQGDSNASR
jgi:hypothetical protein